MGNLQGQATPPQPAPRTQTSKYQNIKISKYPALGPWPKMEVPGMSKIDFQTLKNAGLDKTMGRRGPNQNIRLDILTRLPKYRTRNLSGSSQPPSPNIKISKYQNIRPHMAAFLRKTSLETSI